jgi:hypothetical protein
MPKVPYPYEVNGKSVTGNGSLIPICSLSNRSLLPSLTVPINSMFILISFADFFQEFIGNAYKQQLHLTKDSYRNGRNTPTLIFENLKPVEIIKKLFQYHLNILKVIYIFKIRRVWLKH